MCHPNDSPNVTHKHFYPRPHSHVTLTLGLSPLTNFCFPSCLRRCFRNSSRITDVSSTHKFPRNSIFLWQPAPSPPPGSSWSFPSWVGVCVRVCVYAQVGVEEECCQSNRLNRFRDSNQKKRHKSPRRSWFGLWVFRENPPQFALSLDRGFSSWKMPRRRRRTSSRDAAVYGPTSTLNVIVGRNFGWLPMMALLPCRWWRRRRRVLFVVLAKGV